MGGATRPAAAGGSGPARAGRASGSPVLARRPISSSAGGSGTCRCSAAAEISSTSARIASTGASARPTTTHRHRHHDQQQRQPDRQQPADRRHRLIDQLRSTGRPAPSAGPAGCRRRWPRPGTRRSRPSALRPGPRPRPTSRAQPSHRWAAFGVRAGRDHAPAPVQHLDQQLVGIVDGQRPGTGGAGARARGQHRGHVLGTQPGRRSHLPGQRGPAAPPP